MFYVNQIFKSCIELGAKNIKSNTEEKTVSTINPNYIGLSYSVIVGNMNGKQLELNTCMHGGGGRI